MKDDLQWKIAIDERQPSMVDTFNGRLTLMEEIRLGSVVKIYYVW